MSPQKFIAVLVVSSGLLVACTGAVPSSLLGRETRSAKKPAKDAKTYNITTGAGERKVIITDDRVEVVVAGREREGSSNQTIQELKNLWEANKAMEERLRALEKLNGDDFAVLFPRKGTTDYVVMQRRIPTLQAVTGCMWIKSSSTDTSGTPFSYAVPSNRDGNELMLYNYKNLALFVDDQRSQKQAGPVNDGRWHHVCFTWENSAGSWGIYVDGSQKAAGTGLKKGHVIRSGGALVLGQDQDSLMGGFKASQSFVGMMSQVNLWNRVLSAQEISEMAQSCRSGEGNVLKWSDFKPGIRGAVQVIEPSPCSP